MRIREATSGDINQLISFQTAMALETESVILDQSVIHAGMKQLLDNPAHGKYYVAEVDGKLAGCLMTTFEFSEWRHGRVLWIQSVYVEPAFRGEGIYKAMYRYIQEIVKNDASLKGIRLYAEKNNLAAHDVYKKLGMNGDHYIVFEWMNS